MIEWFKQRSGINQLTINNKVFALVWQSLSDIPGYANQWCSQHKLLNVNAVWSEITYHPTEQEAIDYAMQALSDGADKILESVK